MSRFKSSKFKIYIFYIFESVDFISVTLTLGFRIFEFIYINFKTILKKDIKQYIVLKILNLQLLFLLYRNLENVFLDFKT